MAFPHDADNTPKPTPLAQRLRQVVEEKKAADARAEEAAFHAQVRTLWENLLAVVEPAARDKQSRACLHLLGDERSPSHRVLTALFDRMHAEGLAWEPPRPASALPGGAMELWVSWDEALKPGEHPQGVIYMGKPRMTYCGCGAPSCDLCRTGDHTGDR